MAGELSAHFATGQALYARLFDLATGLVWDGADFVAPDDADWADYVIVVAEDADSGDYRGDMPAVDAGYYQYLTHLQLGGTEAPGDPAVWTGEVQWSGTGLITNKTLYDHITVLQLANSSTDSSAPGAHTRRRGDRWSVSITGMGSLVGRNALWVTLKRTTSLSDAKSTLQVTELDGLLVLNGTAVTGGDAALASVTVDDEDAGDITFDVAGEASAQVDPRQYVYDVQALLSPDGPDTMDHGTFTVVADVTRATEAP